jgi:DMSO/TMAO reductase YedYZ molybdopterin-dependent catalytic subunit
MAAPVTARRAEATATAVRRRFTSPLHDPRTAAVLGIALGISFTICFVTGVLSHLIQQPPGWFGWPPRPAGLYRVTQGLHVATGIATVPLLLVKLWVVYPKLWTWPPARGAAHALERLSLVPLVAGGVFLLFSGVANVAGWYPWDFFFPAAHYWASWITIGALVVHVGAKAGVARASLRRRSRVAGPERPSVPGGLTRRQLLGTTAAASVVLTLATIGQTFTPLGALAGLAQRRPGIGPQGLPVNKTARSAGVLDLARDPDFRLVIAGRVDRPLALSLADLRAMDQHTAVLPIACVEGWSATATWTGVPVRELLVEAGLVDLDRAVDVESLQPGGRYRRSRLEPSHAADPDTILAMAVNGEPLHIDHGYPVRLVGPNRPGVMQTKWVSKLVVG